MEKLGPKLIPKQQLLNYWQKVALVTLPFLQKREITIEQVFGNNVIYRRHPKGGGQDFIYIQSKRDILDWGYKHTYSFHPYICPLNTKGACWFVLDVDPKLSGVKFDVVRELALFSADFFNKLGLKYLVKFCGKNGFHFLWAWDKRIVEKRLFEINKGVIKKLLLSLFDTNLGVSISTSDANMREELLAAGYNVKEVERADVVLDAKILHHHGNIRSPFSIHPATGLVSVPLEQGYVTVKEFVPEKHATLKVVEGNIDSFHNLSMPVNKVELLFK